jgi:hypothetical protein
MHDTSGAGDEFFKCDFCHSPWSEDRPMVEGHRGSLICAECLTLACVEVTLLNAGVDHHNVDNCTMCLAHKEAPYWRSPLHAEAVICRPCIEQSARLLEKDPDAGWKRPGT